MSIKQEVTMKQEVGIKQEVFVVEQEPRAADVPPVFISAEKPTSAAVVSGQVEQQQHQAFMLLLLIAMETLSLCGH